MRKRSKMRFTGAVSFVVLACLVALSGLNVYAAGAADLNETGLVSVESRADYQSFAQFEEYSVLLVSIDAYKQGDFGEVIVDEPIKEDFSSEAAWREYRSSWYDKSWKGEKPKSGRYTYAHYEEEEGFEWVAGELIAAVSDRTTVKDKERIAEKLGAKLGPECSAKPIDGLEAVLLFYEDDGIDPLACAQRAVSEIPEIVLAFPNVVCSSSWLPNDQYLSQQGYLDLSRFKLSWDVVRCNGFAKVAVLDSGIDFAHSDFYGSGAASNIDVVNAYDAIEREQLAGSFADSYGHGTRVSGIVSARADNGVGITGCSYNAAILPVRVLDNTGNGAVWDVGEGLGHLFDLSDKPDVVNMSFGFAADEWYDVIGSVAYHLLCQGSINELAADYDVVFVAAAGNNGETSNATEYPAALTSVIGVASVDNSKNHAVSSTANATVDICAQGHAVYSTKPGGGYESKNGTSFAAPQVAAAAALLRVQHPSWTAYQIESRLESTAEDLGASGRDDTFGYGLLDVAAAVGWTPPGSPFTGPSDDNQATALQSAAQRRLQRTAPDAIPAALERAMGLNPDVFAWLHVPGTSVSLPVARRAGDEGYYLGHDCYGNESPIGCAYVAGSANSDLSDAVTAVYGHSFSSGGLAFTSLHRFEDAAFFASHDRAYVYLPGRRLEYRVVGAYLYTGRGIGSLDQSDPGELADYFAMLSDEDPSTFVGYKRRGALDPESDRVLQLSTCTVPADPSLRMVVTCVLVGE